MEVVVTLEGLGIVGKRPSGEDIEEWKLIKSWTGEEEEVKPQAEDLKHEWMSKGMPERDLRITVRAFASPKLKWKME